MLEPELFGTLQNKPLNLSNLIRDPDAIVEDFNKIPNDNGIEYVKEYGIGIDCHSQFIEICIRYRNGGVIKKAQAHFSTNWDDLVATHDWSIGVLKSRAYPVPDLSWPLHYLVESTANCHMPICMAWKGNPTIITPTITGATKPIPMEVRTVLREEYGKFDRLNAQVEEYKSSLSYGLRGPSHHTQCSKDEYYPW